MAKFKTNFDPQRAKGNNTGLGKNSNEEKRQAMTNAVITEFGKRNIKGFRVCFAVGEGVYSVFMTAQDALNRTKLESDGKTLKMFAPFSRPQAVDLAETAFYIGSRDELAETKEKYECTNNGYAVEYLLANRMKKPFDHHKDWTEGNGEFGGYEVKFFDFGIEKATTSPRAKLTTVDQLAKLGYKF